MISFCLIAKDEEKWIQECLQSISPLADQIVFADTGSSDRTIAIAKTFEKIDLFQIPWKSHFGDARNQTIEKASQPWIFSFDADERIGAKDIEGFRKLISEADKDPTIEAISLVRRDYVYNPSVSGFKPCVGDYPELEGSYPGYYEERMVRIFRNKPHIRWVGSLHEMVDSTLRGKILASNIVFHHFGYLPDEMERKQKRNFYEQAGQRKTSENPNDWKSHFDLAVEYVGAQNYEAAIPLFKKAEALGAPLHLALSNRGYAEMSLKRFAEAEATLKRCVETIPKFHDGQLNLGCVLMRTNRLAEAIERFQILLQDHPQSFLAYRNMGLCYAHMRNFHLANHCLEKAIEVFPNYTDAKLDLATLKLHSQKLEAARTIVMEALTSDPKNQRGQAILGEIDRIQAQRI